MSCLRMLTRLRSFPESTAGQSKSSDLTNQKREALSNEGTAQPPTGSPVGGIFLRLHRGFTQTASRYYVGTSLARPHIRIHFPAEKSVQADRLLNANDVCFAHRTSNARPYSFIDDCSHHPEPYRMNRKKSLIKMLSIHPEGIPKFSTFHCPLSTFCDHKNDLKKHRNERKNIEFPLDNQMQWCYNPTINS